MTVITTDMECPTCHAEELSEVEVTDDGYATWICPRCEEEVERDGMEYLLEVDDWPLKA